MKRRKLKKKKRHSNQKNISKNEFKELLYENLSRYTLSILSNQIPSNLKYYSELAPFLNESDLPYISYEFTFYKLATKIAKGVKSRGGLTGSKHGRTNMRSASKAIEGKAKDKSLVRSLITQLLKTKNSKIE